MGHGEEFAHHDAIGGKVRPGGMIMSSLDHAMFTYMNDDLRIYEHVNVRRKGLFDSLAPRAHD